MDIKKVTNKRVILLGLAVVVVATTSAVVRRASSESVKPAATGANAAAMPAQGAPASRHAQLIRVWVHGDDIYPDVVRGRPGKILLRAENETLGDISLVVERLHPGQANEHVTRISTERRGKRVHEELALGVGEYVFYEASRPEVRGKLIIDPPRQ